MALFNVILIKKRKNVSCEDFHICYIYPYCKRLKGFTSLKGGVLAYLNDKPFILAAVQLGLPPMSLELQ